MFKNFLQRVSQAPTNPQPVAESKEFDVADLYRGPVTISSDAVQTELPLDEKLRQAYFWIVNHAIISPFYDIEYQDGASQIYELGDHRDKVVLPSGQSYCSFVLLPLLTFSVRAKCLLVGGPGRGKTTSAILMGILAGYPIREVRRAIQKGQPQMTIADLLGSPLPADIVKAQSLDQIGIAWRKWLGMRVKIIDEYNRIPTRTQSALLTLMSDNYAEIYDQTFECPPSAWYLTANDDAGGGTYQVIEALRDRIDVVVKALHFNSRFLGELLNRIESGLRPEEIVPAQSCSANQSSIGWKRRFAPSKSPEPFCGASSSLPASLNTSNPLARNLNTKPKIRSSCPRLIGIKSPAAKPVKIS